MQSNDDPEHHFWTHYDIHCASHQAAGSVLSCDDDERTIEINVSESSPALFDRKAWLLPLRPDHRPILFTSPPPPQLQVRMHADRMAALDMMLEVTGASGKTEGLRHGIKLADGSKTLADYNIKSGSTLFLDVLRDVTVVTCCPGVTVFDVDDVVIFVGSASGDVPQPLETQALYRIIAREAVITTEAIGEGACVYTVHYLGGGGRISIFDGEIETPGDASVEFSMVKIQPCKSIATRGCADELWLWCCGDTPPAEVDDYIMFWGLVPPRLSSSFSAVFKIGHIRPGLQGGFEFSVSSVEGPLMGLGLDTVSFDAAADFGFARAVSVDAIFRPECCTGEVDMPTVERIDRRRRDDRDQRRRNAEKTKSKDKKAKRHCKEYEEPDTPFDTEENRIYVRTSVPLSSHMRSRLVQSAHENRRSCSLHFFVPEHVADGGAYSWKLFKAINKQTRISCAAKLHNLDTIGHFDKTLAQKRSYCVNTLNQVQLVVDAFFKSFPNVVKTFDILHHYHPSDDKQHICEERNEFLYLSIYTVMEYIQGGTLFDLCCRIVSLNSSQSPMAPPLCLNERVVFTIASQILSVLKFLTDKVAHRDIKPLNITLCKRLTDHQLRILCSPPSEPEEFIEILNQIEIKVIDFDSSNLDGGTVGFRAPETHFPPEEVSGSKKPEPDIFSFGVTLYALATNGLLPWHPHIAGCKFEDNVSKCGSIQSFIRQQHVEEEQQFPILDDQTGCVFITGQYTELPSVEVITELAHTRGSPNTTICLCPRRPGPHSRINFPTSSEDDACYDGAVMHDDAMKFYGRSEALRNFIGECTRLDPMKRPSASSLSSRHALRSSFAPTDGLLSPATTPRAVSDNTHNHMGMNSLGQLTGHHTSLFYRDGSCTVTNTFMLFLNSAILPNEAYDNWRRIQHYIHTSKSSVETPTMKDDEIQRLFEAAQWSLTNFNVDPKCQRCSGCRKEHSELKSEYLTPDGKLRIMPITCAQTYELLKCIRNCLRSALQGDGGVKKQYLEFLINHEELVKILSCDVFVKPVVQQQRKISCEMIMMMLEYCTHDNATTGDDSAMMCWNPSGLNIHNCIRLLGYDYSSPSLPVDGEDFVQASSDEEKLKWTSLIAMITEQLFKTLETTGGPDPQRVLSCIQTLSNSLERIEDCKQYEGNESPYITAVVNEIPQCLWMKGRQPPSPLDVVLRALKLQIGQGGGSGGGFMSPQALLMHLLEEKKTLHRFPILDAILNIFERLLHSASVAVIANQAIMRDCPELVQVLLLIEEFSHKHNPRVVAPAADPSASVVMVTMELRRRGIEGPIFQKLSSTAARIRMALDPQCGAALDF